MEKEIGLIQKNIREVVIVQFTEFHGNTYVDMRVHATNKPGVPPIPTKKGLCLNPELMPDFLALVTEACKVINGDGEGNQRKGGERVDGDSEHQKSTYERS